MPNRATVLHKRKKRTALLRLSFGARNCVLSRGNNRRFVFFLAPIQNQ